MNTRPTLRLVHAPTDLGNKKPILPNNTRANGIRGAWGMFDDLDQFFALKAKTTSKQYRQVLGEFCDFCGIKYTEEGATRLKTVAHVEVTRYTNHLRTLPAQQGRSALVSDRVSLATVKHKLIILCSIWDELLHLGSVTANPWRKARKDMRRIHGNDRRPHQLIPFDKVRELFTLEFIGPEGARDKALLAALFGGALRINEALAVRLCDVKEGPEGSIVLTLRNTKRQRAEDQAIGAWAARHIRAYFDARKAEGGTDLDPLFTKYRDRTPTNEFLLDRTVRRQFTGYMRRVGLTGQFSPHCARATAITKLLEDGVPHREVVKFSRHASVQMLERYDKLRHANSDNVAQRLEF
jgi:site-specific recombinase XerD